MNAPLHPASSTRPPRPLPAIISAIAYAFSGFFIVSVNFTMVIAAAAWLPLVLAMIALGIWFNAVLRVGPAMSSDVRGKQAIASFSLYARLMAGIGLIVLLLTAIAQFA